ncbi:ATP-binding protein [Flavobacteriaceae bacterium]|nr:ATP-binding protein [Flavobacteriaceae bacterium]MDC3238184.1 ATP-binding protein [Flavobacteriaceae bacterium]
MTFIKKNKNNSWLLVAFFIVALILWNTNILFQNLKKEERAKMELWGMAQQELIENTTVNNLTFHLVFRQTWINPMIQVDEKGKIIGFKNIDWDPKREDSLVIYNRLDKIKRENQPILIRYQDSLSNINQKLYYGDSILLKKLQYYPLALLLIIFLFGAVLYFVFKTSRISEQNRLWAAMAKETAHQIGTPLTSMIGWITLLQEKEKSEPLDEMAKDIERLQIITDRFSKVGSLPELSPADVVSETQKTLQYLKRRSSDLIQFQSELPDKKIMLPLNTQLFSWTLENLMKNGIDAMKGKGEISLKLRDEAHAIHIEISDTGSGIKKENFKKIFSPGFTTKKRGWGLGLSLAKRIIVDYHKGKISVKSSELDKGTTFEIVLKKH